MTRTGALWPTRTKPNLFNERRTQTRSDTSYNGWTNYETWAVALWMDNEQGSQEYWHEQAREMVERHDDPQMRAVLFADALKEQHEESLPELRGFAADLMNSAMAEVNGREIAEHLFTDREEVA